MGGDGADQLFGGAGRDLLIGGLNSDWLWGGEEDDILIGASTIYDGYDTQAKIDAIDGIMAIWTSSATYDQRVATLSASGGLLPASAIFNDDDSDVYIGGGGIDLYFADLDDSGSDDIVLFTSVLEEIIEV
jgi:Ca2+-binding RTX toxin-like protein